MKVFATASFLLACLHATTSVAQLQVTPGPRDILTNYTARAEAIQQTASLIKNEQRVQVVNGQSFLTNYGPVARPGSLAYNITMSELGFVQQFANPNLQTLGGAAAKYAPTIKTIEDYAHFYDSITSLIDRPLSLRNDDVSFGEQRLTIRGFQMKLVRKGEYDFINTVLTDAQVNEVCGASLADVRAKDGLYVLDYSDIAQFNDPAATNKRVSNLQGFFCLNKTTGKFLPLAIRDVDSDLVYSRFDTPEEWTLAKMALNAVEVNTQQIGHFATLHLFYDSMLVELMRAVSDKHPVAALIKHHMAANIGLYTLGIQGLLSANTAFDRNFAFGATGGLRYVKQILSTRKFSDSFETSIKNSGLDKLPNHRYIKYASKLNKAISKFVDDFLHTYYKNDKAVAGDREIQAWAAAMAALPNGNDFPTEFKTIASLKQIINNVIFDSAVKHHALNSDVTWHVASLPYSPASIAKELPKTKVSAGGAVVNLMEYVPSPSHLVEAVVLTATFERNIPVEKSLLNAYKAPVFQSEGVLHEVIVKFESDMQGVEQDIVANEADENNQTFSYPFLKPSKLPYFVWI